MRTIYVYRVHLYNSSYNSNNNNNNNHNIIVIKPQSPPPLSVYDRYYVLYTLCVYIIIVVRRAMYVYTDCECVCVIDVLTVSSRVSRALLVTAEILYTRFLRVCVNRFWNPLVFCRDIVRYFLFVFVQPISQRFPLISFGRPRNQTACVCVFLYILS